jgi:hypothetical protein
LLAATAGDYKARNFGESSRDECSDGIVAKAKSVTDAGSDGDDVFQRAAKFYADDIVTSIDAEAGVAQSLLHSFR